MVKLGRNSETSSYTIRVLTMGPNRSRNNEVAEKQRNGTLATVITAANKFIRLIGRELVDGGANGTLCASDMKLVAVTKRKVNIKGVSENILEDNIAGTYITTATSNFGRVLVCINEGAGVPDQSNSVFSKVQLTDYGCKVDDTSILHGGKQVLISRCGHHFPLELHNGL